MRNCLSSTPSGLQVWNYAAGVRRTRGIGAIFAGFQGAWRWVGKKCAFCKNATSRVHWNQRSTKRSIGRLKFFDPLPPPPTNVSKKYIYFPINVRIFWKLSISMSMTLKHLSPTKMSAIFQIRVVNVRTCSKLSTWMSMNFKHSKLFARAILAIRTSVWQSERCS